jgi:hypothetical protein
MGVSNVGVEVRAGKFLGMAKANLFWWSDQNIHIQFIGKEMNVLQLQWSVGKISNFQSIKFERFSINIELRSAFKSIFAMLASKSLISLSSQPGNKE